jgi:hypothetical protein
VTWTYDSTLASNRDIVRFEIQDTDTNDQLFANEEIDAVLTAEGSVAPTVLRLSKKLMMKFARLVDTSVGRVSESASQRYQAYKEIVERLENELGAAYCMPSFGGVEVSANESLDEDDDLVQPKNKIDGESNLADRNTFGGGS